MPWKSKKIICLFPCDMCRWFLTPPKWLDLKQLIMFPFGPIVIYCYLKKRSCLMFSKYNTILTQDFNYANLQILLNGLCLLVNSLALFSSTNAMPICVQTRSVCFNSSAALVQSQLVCLLPVGILNLLSSFQLFVSLALKSPSAE